MDLSYLTKLAKRYHVEEKANFPTLANLSILYRENANKIEALIYEPVMCLILQGGKVTSIGDQHVDLRVGDALLVSHDLPVVSRITTASRDQPYIAVILSLDLRLVRSLRDELTNPARPNADVRSLSAFKADPEWLAPLVRYIELMDNPMDAKILGPQVLREVHYRLLLSPIGGMLRRLLVMDSHASRVAEAIHLLRSEFRSPLMVSDLSARADMSTSSFHKHFKLVTGTTPLQYQKDLRLIEARALLIERMQSVSDAAHAVGYESPTHFSRDYSKKFGLPPSHERAAQKP